MKNRCAILFELDLSFSTKSSVSSSIVLIIVQITGK